MTRRPFNVWILKDCPSCAGSGVQVCPTCELPCEHDTDCNRCQATGKVPGRDVALFPFLSIGEGLGFRSRTNALTARDQHKGG